MNQLMNSVRVNLQCQSWSRDIVVCYLAIRTVATTIRSATYTVDALKIKKQITAKMNGLVYVSNSVMGWERGRIDVSG